jgi:hypothetical protein
MSRDLRLATTGKILEGDSKGMFLRIEDDAHTNGGFLVLTARDADFRDGFDDWCENRAQLEKYFDDKKWVVEWLE